MVLVGKWFLIAVRIDYLIDLLLTTVFCYTTTVSLIGRAFSFFFFYSSLIYITLPASASGFLEAMNANASAVRRLQLSVDLQHYEVVILYNWIKHLAVNR